MANDELGRLMMEQGNERCEEKIYDLEERTAVFGEKAVHFAKRIPRSPVTFSLISQFVDSSTSIGANYCEADDAVSKSAFRKRKLARRSFGCE
jgi:four helix bundle protein